MMIPASKRNEWDEDDDIAMTTLIGMEKNKRPKHGGSIVKSANPVHPKRYFRHRSKMAPNLFLHIANSVKEHDQFFVQRGNCARDLGHNTFDAD